MSIELKELLDFFENIWDVRDSDHENKIKHEDFMICVEKERQRCEQIKPKLFTAVLENDLFSIVDSNTFLEVRGIKIC